MTLATILPRRRALPPRCRPDSSSRAYTIATIRRVDPEQRLGRNPSHRDGDIQNLLRLRPARRFENMRPLPEPALLQPRMPAERLEEAQGELRAARAAAAAANKQVR